MDKQYEFFNIRDNVVIDGVLYRVLDVVADPDHPDSGTVFCIELKNPRIKIRKYSMEEFKSLYESGNLTVRETDEMPLPTEADADDRELMAKRKQAIDEALALIYPDYDAFEHRKGKEVIQHICDKLVVSDSSARSLLNRYMKSGLNEFSLMDMRQGWNASDSGNAVVNGRKNSDGTHSKVVMNDETINNFEMAFRYFKENTGSGVNLSDAYIYLIDMFYTDEESLERLPEDECPSYRRFRSYVEKRLEGTSIRDFTKAEREKYKALPYSEKNQAEASQTAEEAGETRVIPEEYSDLLDAEDLELDTQQETSDAHSSELSGITFDEGEEVEKALPEPDQKISVLYSEESPALEAETEDIADQERIPEDNSEAIEEQEPVAKPEENEQNEEPESDELEILNMDDSEASDDSDDSDGFEERRHQREHNRAENKKKGISHKLFALVGVLAAVLVLVMTIVFVRGGKVETQESTALASEAVTTEQETETTLAITTTEAATEVPSTVAAIEETETTIEAVSESSTETEETSSVEITIEEITEELKETETAEASESETAPEESAAEVVSEAKPAETKPAETKPAETKPAKTEVTEAQTKKSSNVTTDAQKAAARSSRYLRITGDYVNVRDASTREPIRSYPQGTILEQIGESNDPDWLLVNLSGQNAYISSDYVVSADGDDHKQYYRLTGDRVNVRDSADRSQIITTLPKGMVIETAGSYDNDNWVRFRYEGRDVVMYAAYLEAVNENSSAPKQNVSVAAPASASSGTAASVSASAQNQAQTASNYYELTGDNVYVRDAADQNIILGMYPKGTIFERTGAAVEGWLPVSVGGKKAVVSTDYLAAVSAQSSDKLYRTTEETSYVYASDKTTVLAELPSGIIIKSTGSDEDWVWFTYGGKKAAISQDVLEEIK